jgi:hypothetical protein
MFTGCRSKLPNSERIDKVNCYNLRGYANRKENMLLNSIRVFLRNCKTAASLALKPAIAENGKTGALVFAAAAFRILMILSFVFLVFSARFVVAFICQERSILNKNKI